MKIFNREQNDDPTYPETTERGWSEGMRTIKHKVVDTRKTKENLESKTVYETPRRH